MYVKRKGDTDCDAQDFVVTSMYAWHVDSRWYTSDFWILIIDFEAFVPSWHQTFYPGLKEIGVYRLFIYLLQM
jgi:hypothetical protein